MASYQTVLVETPEEQAARNARPGEINGDLFDRFSLVHGTAGGIAHRIGLSFPATMALAIAFEFAERRMKRAAPRLFPNPTQDSPTNAFGDVIATAVGYMLSRKINGRSRRRKP